MFHIERKVKLLTYSLYFRNNCTVAVVHMYTEFQIHVATMILDSILVIAHQLDH